MFARSCNLLIFTVERYKCLPLKAGFHMIADRLLQIAIRSAIVCDRLRSSAVIWKHTSAIVCDPAITIAEDKAGFHMIADRRSQIAMRSAIVCDHMETYFCDRLRS